MPLVALTDRFCSGAKPLGGRRTDYFDSNKDNRGLALRVGEGGHKAWTYHYTSPRTAKRARVAIGTYPATSLAAARTRALEAKGHVEAGDDPRDVFAAQTSGALTVAGLVESYLAKHVRPSLRTAKSVERRFTKDVLPVIGTVRVADLHKRDVNRVVDPILARGARIAAARAFEDMRAVFRWAVARGDMDRNPAEGMRKPAVSQPRERVLSDDEVRALWHGLPVALARSKACQRILKLCLVTAQRVGEVSGMRVDELDLDAAFWSIPGSRTKNGRAHAVPLSDLAVDIIGEALADAGDSPFVFPCDDETAFDPAAVSRTLGRACIVTKALPQGRIGVDKFTAHDLRRTALTAMAKLGVAPVVAGAVANHVSVTRATITLSVYTSYSYEREKREALDLWAERLTAIITGEGADVVPMKAGGKGRGR